MTRNPCVWDWKTVFGHYWLTEPSVGRWSEFQVFLCCVVFQHLSERVAMYVHAYTLYSAVRPFGCRWVQSRSSHLSVLHSGTTHTVWKQMRSNSGRDDDWQWFRSFGWTLVMSLLLAVWPVPEPTCTSTLRRTLYFSVVLEGIAGVVSVAFAGSCVLFGCSPVASPVLIFVSSGSFILGSHDKDDGPQLYMVDPSGISYVSYHQIRCLLLLAAWNKPEVRESPSS